MPAIQTSAVIGKNTDGSDITQDVDVLVWWRDVGQARFPRITVMARQILAIPESSTTAERVFSFAGLTLSDLRKRLLEGTLEAIMWAKWSSVTVDWPDSKFDSACVRVSELLSVLSFLIRQ